MNGLWFELSVDPSELPRDARQVPALVSVAARRGDRGAVTAGRAAEIIIMDRSLSMQPYGKLHEAKRAVAAAIEALSDDTYFAVIAGNHAAELVYPADGTLRPATAEAKREARSRVAALDAVGGTAMSHWLLLADRLFRQVPDAVRHAVLYTDGDNEHDSTSALGSALNECRDHYVCDVRGVGIDWKPQVLRRIAEALQGETEAITDVKDLPDDFAGLMERTQRLLVPRVYLRLTLNGYFRVESVKQIEPHENDLTGSLLPQDGRVTDVPLLAWGEESRDYLVLLRVEPGTPKGDEMRAARLDVMADAGNGRLESCAAPTAMIVRWLRHRGETGGHNGATEAQDLMRIGAATRAGIAAYKRGDEAAALAEFRLAVTTARSLGALDHLERLRRLVIVNEAGEVRLCPEITEADLLTVDLRSTRHRGGTGLGDHGKPAAGSPPARSALVSRTCPNGHETRGIHVRYCEECDHEFTGDDG